MARRRTHTEAWWANAAPHVLRCTGHLKSDGSRCRSEASPGTSVCDKHGALTPAVQQAAATRIQMSVDEAAKQLVAWMNDANVDMRERVKIAHDLLDRGGLAATQKHMVGIARRTPWNSCSRTCSRTRTVFAQPAGELSAKNIEPDPDDSPLLDSWDGDIVDAEVVEDGPTPAQIEAARQPAKPSAHAQAHP